MGKGTISGGIPFFFKTSSVPSSIFLASGGCSLFGFSIELLSLTIAITPSGLMGTPEGSPEGILRGQKGGGGQSPPK